jgi:hypothetical protein
MKVKMKSRQATYQQTVDPNARLEDTDRFSFCAEINEKAFQFALARAPPRTSERFASVGVWPVFDPDIRCVRACVRGLGGWVGRGWFAVWFGVVCRIGGGCMDRVVRDWLD